MPDPEVAINSSPFRNGLSVPKGELGNPVEHYIHNGDASTSTSCVEMEPDRNGVDSSSDEETSDSFQSSEHGRNSSTPSMRGRGGGRGHRPRRRGARIPKNAFTSANQLYKYSCHVELDTKSEVFGVAFNPYHEGTGDTAYFFAACAGDRVYVFSCSEDGEVKSVGRVFEVDFDRNPESFYTLTWCYGETYSQSNRKMSDGPPEHYVVAAGSTGVIHLFSISRLKPLGNLVGNGHSINDLKTHPTERMIIAAGGKDRTVRLWNVARRQLVGIFGGGTETHTDEVIGVAFDALGDRLATGSMDHTVGIWFLRGNEQVTKGGEDLVKYAASGEVKKPFKVEYPDFRTGDVHSNYVDCVAFMGDFVLSKSINDSVTFWKPGSFDKSAYVRNETVSSFISDFGVRDCDLWYIRFALEQQELMLAIGNTRGVIYVYELGKGVDIRAKVLMHKNSTKTIRQVSFSPDRGRFLVACAVDGTLWLWEKNKEFTGADEFENDDDGKDEKKTKNLKKKKN